MTDTLILGDGRSIEVATVGDPSGRTVFFHHGTPGSTALLRSLAPLTERANLFLVATTRPGYGTSTRQAGRSVGDVVADVRAVLDHLGRDSYISVGWSGGGPHSLACAALDAPRCEAAVSIAGVAPADVDFDWTEGMGPENVEEFALAKEGGPAYEAIMEQTGQHMRGATADNVIELFGGLLPDVDKAALADEVARAALAQACAEAFAHDWRGYLDDNVAIMAPWGFSLGDIAVPTSLWFGDADLMVPPTHGHWMARTIPGTIVRHFPVEGHISVMTNHFDEFAAELSELGRS